MSDEIKKGLLGIVVDETQVSKVMPEINSLTYRGYAVQDLCEMCRFEEAAYLILYGDLPNSIQLKKFEKEERSNRNLTKNNLIATKAACQTITHFGKIPLFIFLFNFKYADNLYVIIPLAIAVFIGTKIGKKILGFIPEEIFIKLFKTTLFLIAVKLITTAYTF